MNKLELGAIRYALEEALHQMEHIEDVAEVRLASTKGITEQVAHALGFVNRAYNAL